MGPNLVIFAVAAFVLIVTPGPNFFYVLTRAATQGRRAGVVAACGLGAGVVVHTTLATLGIAAVVRSSYLAFRAIKYGGSLYLIVLGIKAARNRPAIPENSLAMRDKDSRVLWQSIVASLTNPKTILFFLSFLPQFVSGPASSASRQMLTLGGIYTLLTMLVYSVLACLAGSATRWLRQSRARANRLRWLAASSFIGLGVWAALPDRQ
ncbi:MAG: LysE family translocator [Vicinamibacterales bacterium]